MSMGAPGAAQSSRGRDMEQIQPLIGLSEDGTDLEECWKAPVSTASDTPYSFDCEQPNDLSFESRTFRAMSKRRVDTRVDGADRAKHMSATRFLSLWTRKLLLLLRQHPLMGLLWLMGLAVVGTAIGFTVKYILDPDKERMPWRDDCALQPPFVNADVDHLAPVDVFVGVMSYDRAFERRNVIRNTYAAMTLPHDEQTGRPLGNVQVKFILGRPHKKYAESVALEMEMYNDLVILDAEETGSSYKTLSFFRWAAENATVPVLVPRDQHGLVGAPALDGQYDVHWKLADYVLKADDDTFLVLDELERRLRALPRKMVYWGCTYYSLTQISSAAGLWPARRTPFRTTSCSIWPSRKKLPVFGTAKKIPRWPNT